MSTATLPEKAPATEAPPAAPAERWLPAIWAIPEHHIRAAAMGATFPAMQILAGAFGPFKVLLSFADTSGRPYPRGAKQLLTEADTRAARERAKAELDLTALASAEAALADAAREAKVDELIREEAVLRLERLRLGAVPAAAAEFEAALKEASAAKEKARQSQDKADRARATVPRVRRQIRADLERIASEQVTASNRRVGSQLGRLQDQAAELLSTRLSAMVEVFAQAGRDPATANQIAESLYAEFGGTV
jgi:hypothetical protein